MESPLELGQGLPPSRGMTAEREPKPSFSTEQGASEESVCAEWPSQGFRWKLGLSCMKSQDVRYSSTPLFSCGNLPHQKTESQQEPC